MENRAALRRIEEAPSAGIGRCLEGNLEVHSSLKRDSFPYVTVEVAFLDEEYHALGYPVT